MCLMPYLIYIEYKVLYLYIFACFDSKYVKYHEGEGRGKSEICNIGNTMKNIQLLGKILQIMSQRENLTILIIFAIFV